jgi:succinyl-CoA synthetase beta subunit
MALDAKAVIDDNALRRQPYRCEAEAPATELEKRAREIGVNYVPLEGDVAVLAGGAGLAMATMALVNYTTHTTGSFLDTGGGISAEHTAEALRISMTTPGIKGALINIFGGINNCETIARGVVAYLEADKPGLPVVVKMRGHSQDEGWALLEQHNVPHIRFGTTEEAVRLLVSIMDGEK